MRSFRRTLLPLLILFGPPLFGQGTGSITGTIRDNTGAVVTKAEVTLTDTGTRNSLKTTTNADGEYLFAAVPPGTYDLTVTAVGFNTYAANGVVLRVAQRARADATLTVGEVKTTVTVEAATATQVETESSEVSGVVTDKEISGIVLNGRNFTQLISLTPGVSNQTGQDEGTVGVYGSIGWSINGGRTEYNNWELDGGDNMDNGSNGTLNVYPNVDAIAEFKVLTSNYGAQYGRNGSGTVEVVTKSGTKSFHGDLFEFVRNNDFNAAISSRQTCRLTRRTTSDIPSAAPSIFPSCTTRRRRRPSSSGARSGGRKCCRTSTISRYLQRTSGKAFSMTFAQPPGARSAAHIRTAQ